MLHPKIEALCDMGFDESAVLGEEYNDAIIGVSTDGRVVYSYEKMVESLTSTDDISEEDAIEWIDFNPVRALPYYGETSPIIMHEIK